MNLARTLALFLGVALGSALARETIPLNTGWRFYFGDASGAEAVGFDASAWRAIEVPHDWSIGLPVEATAPSAGSGGFFVTGLGWYRRTFVAPESWRGQRVSVEFDGVYMNSEVWLNGVSLGVHPYGFTPFRYDLTPHLKIGADNVLAVRVDNAAQPSSRWYNGSGIYRHVRLVVTPPIHVAADGVFATTTALSTDTATVQVTAGIRNDGDHAQRVTVEVSLLTAEGRLVASKRAEAEVAAMGDVRAPVELPVTHPRAWSPDSPALYQLVARAFVAERVVDEVSSPFGIRMVRVSAERGFELNGQAVKLNGGNVHHDNGVLGAIALRRADERRVELLKAAGFNAVRTAHNPPSPEFLDACDRFGLLVLDEAFDGWEKKKSPHDYGGYFREWSDRDLTAAVLRDRNHPSVVMWSIGNEVFERGAQSGPPIARTLAARVRELDPTRPVTIGLNNVSRNGDWTKLDPMFAPVDVVGYNYEIARHAAEHARLPARIMVATESYQSEIFANWAIVQEAPYVIGDFVWSALDYLGESGLGRVFPPGEKVIKPWEGNMWPWHGAPCGEIDLIGDRKPESHYRNIVWDRGEKLYAAVLVPPPGSGMGVPPLNPVDHGRDARAAWGLTPWSSPPARASWTWPGSEGRELTVEVYSRYEAVRLYLGGKLLGEKPTTQTKQFKAAFAVPYAAGVLRVCGLRGGREVEEFVLKTAGAAARLSVALDRTKLRADGEDLTFASISVLDQHGVLRPDSDVPVQIAIDGPAVLAGIGNSDLTTTEPYGSNPHRLFEGRALAVLRTTGAAGRIKVTVSSPGLAAATATLESAK